jgi:hypothetical protein
MNEGTLFGVVRAIRCSWPRGLGSGGPTTPDSCSGMSLHPSFCRHCSDQLAALGGVES